jgi:DNA invertase Pin-like site-specific DNA recombinase
VIYAAKSTEDRRGSIPDQLGECRSLIEGDDARRLVAEYTDEGFSAFRRNRGPRLADAMGHAEDLAREHGTAELWAQHSDRLARGDGRSARHAVEIALWALKRDVRVHTVQDPETFRNLLYAVVTGQRNHDDSQRKGMLIVEGRRRAAARGGYLGYKPDGYKLNVELDGHGGLRKRLVIDPDRRPAIEMLFRLALRGRTSGAIARALNKAGWLTGPTAKGRSPESWTVHRVLYILKNPRYAGMSVWKGETLARECWPAYISERQHERIRAALDRPEMAPRRHHEPYLLSRLGVCGRCGSSLHAATRYERVDDSSKRRYVCTSHFYGCHAERCKLVPLPAATIEALFVSALPTLLTDAFEQGRDELRDSDLQEDAQSELAAERQQLIDAVFAGESVQIDTALRRLFTQMAPEAAAARRVATSHRRIREVGDARGFQAWAEVERHGRTDESREEVSNLNRLLRTWFASVAVDMDETSVSITAQRRAAPGDLPPEPVTVRFDRSEQARLHAEPHRKHNPWGKAEILGAMQAWSDTHGRSPTWADWKKADSFHPSTMTVIHHYGKWRRALRRAGLKPVEPGPRRSRQWKNDEIIAAIRAWADEHGRPPTWDEWCRAAPEHPTTQTVRKHFGSWQAALAAARSRRSSATARH